jgi:hypothetical protein
MKNDYFEEQLQINYPDHDFKFIKNDRGYELIVDNTTLGLMFGDIENALNDLTENYGIDTSAIILRALYAEVDKLKLK